MARARRTESEFREEWKPTRDDVELLRADLKPLAQKEIYGRLVSPFEQLCHIKHIIRLEPDGMVVQDPAGYTRYLEIDSYRQSLDFYDLKVVLDAFPEEKETWISKIRAMRPARFTIKTF